MATVTAALWSGYRGIDKLGYIHEPRSQRAAQARGEDPGKLLPAVHRVGSLTKRWLLGTHQASVEGAHLHSYLDEFEFVAAGSMPCAIDAIHRRAQPIASYRLGATPMAR